MNDDPKNDFAKRAEAEERYKKAVEDARRGGTDWRSILEAKRELEEIKKATENKYGR